MIRLGVIVRQGYTIVHIRLVMCECWYIRYSLMGDGFVITQQSTGNNNTHPTSITFVAYTVVISRRWLVVTAGH